MTAMSPSPVFIGGMYKSGTSLLRAMLGRHSRLFAGLETQWLHEDWSTDRDAGRRAWLERIAAFYDAPAAELAAACGGAGDVETCLDRVMTHLTAQADKPRWIEKTPGNAGVIGRILAHWPDARILHIVRDPRDVYASLVENAKWTAPDAFAIRWCGTVAAAREWLAGHGGRHQAYHELRYERLVREPEATIRAILAFLGEPFEAEAAEFPGQREDFERVRAATGKESATLRRLAEPLSTDRIGLWHGVVSTEDWHAVLAALASRGAGSLPDEIMARTAALDTHAQASAS